MTTLPPPTGEIPALSEEEIKALKSNTNTTATRTDDTELGDIRSLTERLMAENLTGGGVDIHENPSTAPDKDDAGPDSMHPERWAMTNRPPSMEDIADIHVALHRKPALPDGTDEAGNPPNKVPGADETEKKAEQTTGDQTAFCVEGSED